MQFEPPIHIENFTRKVFPVEAVRVTRTNISRVAEWCGGDLGQDGNGRPFIKLGTEKSRTNHIKRLNNGFVGDWVVKSEEIFKVFPNKAFVETFEPTNVSIDDRT